MQVLMKHPGEVKNQSALEMALELAEEYIVEESEYARTPGHARYINMTARNQEQAGETIASLRNRILAGTSYARLGNLSKSCEIFNRAQIIAFKQRDYALRKRICEISISFGVQSKDYNEVAFGLFRLAEAYGSLHEKLLARAFFEQAEALAKEKGLRMPEKMRGSIRRRLY